MALLNPCMKLEKKIGQKHSFDALEKCQLEKNFPGSAKSRINAGKSTKRGFSKKGLARIEIFFLF